MHILIGEDDTKLGQELATALAQAGHDTIVAEDGAACLKILQTHTIHAAVLDIGMPELDGLEVIKQTRATGNPVLMILSTALGGLDDKVAGLDAGADDYLVKPYSSEELLARLRALERRSASCINRSLTIADLEIDLRFRTVTRGNHDIILTNREFALLETLALASPRPVSRAALVERVWDRYFDSSSNVVNVYVNYLRKKIDLPGLTPLVHTIRGSGYALFPDPSPSSNATPTNSPNP